MGASAIPSLPCRRAISPASLAPIERLKLRTSKPNRPPGDARFVLVPVPYEQTTTYRKGTVRGPRALLEAATQVELLDEETGAEPVESAGRVFGRYVTRDGRSRGCPSRKRRAAPTETVRRARIRIVRRGHAHHHEDRDVAAG